MRTQGGGGGGGGPPRRGGGGEHRRRDGGGGPRRRVGYSFFRKTPPQCKSVRTPPPSYPTSVSEFREQHSESSLMDNNSLSHLLRHKRLEFTHYELWQFINLYIILVRTSVCNKPNFAIDCKGLGFRVLDLGHILASASHAFANRM